jgi:large subunit ribosomal protein L9
MARRNVTVVLRQDVGGLGTTGEVVKVRPGFARNFLLPRSLAVIASRENVKQIEHEKMQARIRLDRLRKAAEEQAEVYRGLQLHVAKQVADPATGKLFGSVTIADIMEALEVKGFGDVPRRQVVMPEDTIKVTGSYEIHIRLAQGVQVPIKLEVKTAA